MYVYACVYACECSVNVHRIGKMIGFFVYLESAMNFLSKNWFPLSFSYVILKWE